MTPLAFITGGVNSKQHNMGGWFVILLCAGVVLHAILSVWGLS